MNTPTHILLGWAAFGRDIDRRIAAAAILGALAPDLSLYVLAGVSIFVLQISPQVVFDELYFSPLWQSIFAVDNSFLIWGAILLFFARTGIKTGMVFCSAALLHLALDFPLHHDDGRPHFWPLTNWIFESPVSYWDHRHGAEFIAPISAAIAVICGMWIASQNWRQWRNIAVLGLVALEMWALLPGFFGLL